MKLGYSRPSTGHIENGRIVVDHERIPHIVKCFEFKIEDFEKCFMAELMRHEIIEQ
jgi:hypothetical protein